MNNKNIGFLNRHIVTVAFSLMHITNVFSYKTIRNTDKQQTTQSVTNGNVYNATSTPVKDKYASDEKELVDEMTDFIEQKCHTMDTMVKKSRDEIDDENRKRQKMYEEAKQLISGKSYLNIYLL